MISMIAVLALPLVMATSSAGSPTPPAPIDSADMTLVIVQNDRKVRVTVYAEDKFGDHKLGVVAPLDTATLALNEYVSDGSDVEFFVQPVGEFEESSGLLEVHRGERIGLVIPPK